MGQQPQLPPHEDLPLFLSLTSLTIIAVTTTASKRHIRIVAIFSESHASMKIDSFYTLIYTYQFTLTLVVSFVASLWGLKSM